MNDFEKRAAEIESLGGWTYWDDEGIKRVNFEDTKLGHRAIELLSGLEETLENLELDDKRIVDSDLACLAEFTRLDSVSIGTSKKLTGEFLRFIPDGILELCITDCKLLEEHCDSLSQFKSLQRVFIQNVKKIRGGLRHLCALTSLQDVVIQNMKFESDSLSEISRLKNVHRLSFYKTNVDDSALESIADMPELSSLCLWNTKITDAGLPNLYRLTNLTKLDVRKFKGERCVFGDVSKAGVTKLYENLPSRCEILPWIEKADKQRSIDRRKRALSLDKSTTLNYQRWIEKAQNFVGSLSKVECLDDPDIYNSVKPPLSKKKLQSINQELRIPIPTSLAQLLMEGSRSFNFRFLFDVEGELKTKFESELGYSYVYGGPVVKSSRFKKLQKSVYGFAADEEVWLDDEPDQKELWLRAFPFIQTPNGDFIALDTATDETDPAVIYLGHDRESEIIAPNLISFLEAWERICYVGPEWWKLEPFRNDDTGCFETDTESAQRMRDLFAELIA